MPEIQFERLPPGVWRHLSQRVAERQISVEELKMLETWKASEPEAPEGEWYKDFGSFKLVGEGKLPKSVLDADMVAHGEEIT